MADNESSSGTKDENPIQENVVESSPGTNEKKPIQHNVVESSSGTKEENPIQENVAESSSGTKEESPIQENVVESSSGTKEDNPIQENVVDPLVERFQAAAKLEYSFWETQPVVQFKDLDNYSLPEGPIKQPTPLSEVKQEPYNLPNAYEWTVCDISSDEVCNEIYDLLYNYYLSTDDCISRFNYSKEFLRWSLCPPGYFPSWHIGVRAKSSKTLVAFIAAIPVKTRVRDQIIQMAAVNFLCVHKKLRSKRLPPVMFMELTRRINLEDVWQGAYTTARVLPTPVSVTKHWHRQLNTKKLVNIGFSKLAPKMTVARLSKLKKLPDSITTAGLRKMELKDVPSVTVLLNNYLSRFPLAPIFDDEGVKHWLLPQENLFFSYVREDSETGDITDFFSFYTLPISILKNPKYDDLKAAYSFYTVATKVPLDKLMQDALITAKEKNFDVFNALNVMENDQFLAKLKFEPGKGKLCYYLYNYRLRGCLAPPRIGLLLVEA